MIDHSKTTPELYPFQQKAVQWLIKKRSALLAFEMGLGKTAISIRAAETIKLRRILVICPSVAVENWKREWKKWHLGIYHADFEVCSYPTLHKLNTEIRKDLSDDGKVWDLVIIDEAHYLKSPEAVRTRSVLARGGILKYAHRAWCLSGTPAPNHAGELWPILFAFGLTKLKYGPFVDRYCDARDIKIKGYRFSRKQISGTKKENIEELKTILAKFMLRETKESVGLELPPLSFENIVVEQGFTLNRANLNFDEALWMKLEVERDILRAAVEQFGEAALGTVLSSLPTLRRYCGLQKLSETVALLKMELESHDYEKIVVFAIHRQVITHIARSLPEFGAVMIHGGMTASERQVAIDKFQNDVGARVLVANIVAGGIAITLTRASNILFVEQDWVPGNNAQAISRCHRIGQTKNVHVRFLSLSNPIDEKITKALARKTEELTYLFDAESKK